MFWANFLHIYQPPTQTKNILERVVNESYRRVIAELKRAPDDKLTLNIPACLTELLDQYGFDDVIADLRLLLERGQIELTGTAKYHPLLPKIPKEEAIRQIILDHKTNRHYFGEAYQPRGFFPPEAAYNREIAQIVADLGFEWILVEELSYNGQFGAVGYDKCYEVEGIIAARGVSVRSFTDASAPSRAAREVSPLAAARSSCSLAHDTSPAPLKIFFRERDSSFKILSGQLGTIKLFEDYLGGRLNRNEYLLTAMDGETFGHHRPGMEKLLFEIYKSDKVPTVTISQLLELFPRTETVKTIPSTWALMEKDIEKNAPFSRWGDPENEIHKLQWELTRLAIDSVIQSRYAKQSEAGSWKMEDGKDARSLKLGKSSLQHPASSPATNFKPPASSEKPEEQWLQARVMLDRSLHSDQYWWASARPWWSLEMIERGACELLDVVSMTPDASKADKERARELYWRIITLGFEWQRSGKVEEMARREDEEVRERTDEGLPRLPVEEINKMMANIRREMLEVAKKQEYERAAQLRDRIKELEEYKNAGS
jgi:hypothetical protein